ncbi:MAG: nuclear transport factor 2 family protein [Gemmatimonadetes bacterium]|nr:nuclear transport factor 2 family protein [Gemmatimonadota bacterium]
MSTSVPEQLPTAALGRQLIDKFASGWAKPNLDLLLSVFAEGATFSETPFAEPYVGVDAVRRYWADVPYHQSEITVTTGEVFVVGPWFSTEFKSVFRRRRTGEWVEAKGAVFCETDGERITEMRMYWHRRT